MKNSEKLIEYVEKYYSGNKDIVKKIENNRPLIDKDVFTIQDIKYKYGLLISPNGKSTLVHHWKGEFYYMLQGEDWGKFPDYKHVETVNELKPYFLECLNGGANLTGCPAQNIAKYFN